jgi:hypothetical protein
MLVILLAGTVGPLPVGGLLVLWNLESAVASLVWG